MKQQQILSQDEVDALLEGITGDGRPSAAEPAPADGVRGVCPR
jgi:flagellar motor switch protein FliM